MAYYSGTATSLADLRTALLTNAVADGWVLTGDVLSKAGVYFRIQVDATNITCLGCESNAAANPAPNVVQIGKLFERSGYTTRLISFPCNYEVFGFSQELFLIVNYDVDTYQWMAFGKSTVPGLPGQGGWCGATMGSGVIGSGSSSDTAPIIIGAAAGGGEFLYNSTSGALFWGIIAGYTQPRNCWVNHGLDSHGWTWNGAAGDAPIGIRHNSPLLSLQPSGWNSEATLLPLRAYKQRPSFKASLVADIANARLLRIDNLTPGDILTLGADKWKIVPWYRKDASARNGSTTSINHSGTFGWAIRYQGP